MKRFCECCDSKSFCKLGLSRIHQNDSFIKPTEEGCCDAVYIDNKKFFFIEFKNIDKFINEDVPSAINKIKKQLEKTVDVVEANFSETKFFLAYDINKNKNSQKEHDEYNLYRLELFQIIPQAKSVGIMAARCDDTYYILRDIHNLNI